MGSTIDGRSMVGFSDFFGAKPPAKAPGKTGGKVPPPPPHSVKPIVPDANGPHGKALAKSGAAGQAAIAAGKALKASVAKHAADVKAGKHSPVVQVKTHVGIGGQIVIGAVRPVTAKQNALVKNHATAIALNAKANAKANIAAAMATRTGTAVINNGKKALPVVLKVLSGAGQAKTHGKGMVGLGAYLDDVSEDEVVEMYELIGEALGDDAPPNTPDPNAPPSDPAPAAIDPGAQPDGSAGGLDATSGIVTDYQGNVIYDPAKESGLTPMPTRDVPLSQDDAATQYFRVVPPGGIPWAGDFPEWSIGSWRWFYEGDPAHLSSGNKNGFIYTRRGTHFGRDQDRPRWMGQRNEDQVNDVDDNDLGANHSTKDVANSSQRLGFGPLIGNPFMAVTTAGLQYAIDDDKWFWQGDHAPSGMTKEIDSKIAQANADVIKANTATAVAKAASILKDATDKYEALTKQAADEAMAQHKIDVQHTQEQAQAQHEQGITQTKADTAQITETQQQEALKARQDIEKQKQDDAAAAAQAQVETTQQAEQSHADVQQQQVQTTSQAEAQHELVRSASTWNDWAAQHPDEAVKQMQAEGVLPVDVIAPGTSGDDGSLDDGQSMGPPPGPEDEGEVPTFDDGGPSMFEENAQPQVDDVEVGWPFSAEERKFFESDV